MLLLADKKIERKITVCACIVDKRHERHDSLKWLHRVPASGGTASIQVITGQAQNKQVVTSGNAGISQL